ncbi:hypothetical protein DM77_2837 [Burkholderia mallei]|nr:hypothetical protein DM77_2837 [Burkholderia mallei]
MRLVERLRGTGAGHEPRGSRLTTAHCLRLVTRGSRPEVHGSRSVAHGPPLAVLGSWFLVLGSRFAVRGSRFAVRGSRFAVRGSRFAVRHHDKRRAFNAAADRARPSFMSRRASPASRAISSRAPPLLRAPARRIEHERQADAAENRDRRDHGRGRNGLAEQQRAERDRDDRVHVHATARDDRARVANQIAVRDVRGHRAGEHQVDERGAGHPRDVPDALAEHPGDAGGRGAAQADLQRGRQEQIVRQREPRGEMRAARPEERAREHGDAAERRARRRRPARVQHDDPDHAERDGPPFAARDAPPGHRRDHRREERHRRDHHRGRAAADGAHAERDEAGGHRDEHRADERRVADFDERWPHRPAPHREDEEPDAREQIAQPGEQQRRKRFERDVQREVRRAPREIDEHERERDAAAAALRQAGRMTRDEGEKTVERRHRSARPREAPRGRTPCDATAGERRRENRNDGRRRRAERQVGACGGEHDRRRRTDSKADSNDDVRGMAAAFRQHYALRNGKRMPVRIDRARGDVSARHSALGETGFSLFRPPSRSREKSRGATTRGKTRAARGARGTHARRRHTPPARPRPVGSRTAEPVVPLVDPISARIRVGHEYLHDVLRILVAELRRHPQLHRESVFGRQPLAVVFECEQRLRVQRGGHVDALVIVVRAFEADVFRARVRADAAQEFAKRRAAPAADRAPALDANVPRDLLRMRQRIQRRQAPASLAGDETRHGEPEAVRIDARHVVDAVERVERKRARDVRLRIRGREPRRAEQPRLHAIVRARHLLEKVVDRCVVAQRAAGEHREAAKRQHALAEQAPRRQRERLAHVDQQRCAIDSRDVVLALFPVVFRHDERLLLMSTQHREQRARHERRHRDMHDEERDEKRHRPEVHDARAVVAAEPLAQQRELHRFPDHEPGQHEQREIGDRRDVRGALERVVHGQIVVRQPPAQRVAQVARNARRAQRQELARETPGGDAHRQIEHAVEKQQPHRREVPLQRAAEPAAERRAARKHEARVDRRSVVDPPARQRHRHRGERVEPVARAHP